jgi:hypothetical protein
MDPLGHSAMQLKRNKYGCSAYCAVAAAESVLTVMMLTVWHAWQRWQLRRRHVAAEAQMSSALFQARQKSKHVQKIGRGSVYFVDRV